MRKLFFLFVLGSLVVSGCETKTGTGVVTGAALGAVVGGAVGHGEGALIGGAIGAAAGGLVGAALDEQDRKIMEERSPKTVDRMDKGEPITINDVIKLSQGGVSDDTIIRYIQQTKTHYNLTQAQIKKMQDAGVSQRVINYMVETGS
jgi:outer membrane lipoprotein SlyB